MKKMLMLLGVMGGSALILLFALSVLAYLFRWKADTALIGITIIYIVAGFLGGRCKKHFSYETKIIVKLWEGIITGSVFMLLLGVISFGVIGNPLVFGSRFFMIWMIIVGSAALGRIL